jgi:hypothetical protein
MCLNARFQCNGSISVVLYLYKDGAGGRTLSQCHLDSFIKVLAIYRCRSHELVKLATGRMTQNFVARDFSPLIEGVAIRS